MNSSIRFIVKIIQEHVSAFFKTRTAYLRRKDKVYDSFKKKVYNRTPARVWYTYMFAERNYQQVR